MKKIIPFKKQLFLDNTISEITSISLEHTLSGEESKISNLITNFIKRIHH